MRPILLAVWLGLAAACGLPAAWADVDVTFDNAPGRVTLPDNWRPIPRAEIVEARERAQRSVPGTLPRLPTAAFQRLPTLQWFTLPHALLYWEPEARLPAPAGSAGSEADQPSPDIRISEDLGHGPHGLTVHTWHCVVARRDGIFRIDLLTADDDGRALVLGFAQGLRDPH